MIQPVVGEMYELTEDCRARVPRVDRPSVVIGLLKGDRVVVLKRRQWLVGNPSSTTVEVLTQCGRRAIVPVRVLT